MQQESPFYSGWLRMRSASLASWEPPKAKAGVDGNVSADGWRTMAPPSLGDWRGFGGMEDGIAEETRQR